MQKVIIIIIFISLCCYVKGDRRVDINSVDKFTFKSSGVYCTFEGGNLAYAALRDPIPSYYTENCCIKDQFTLCTGRSRESINCYGKFCNNIMKPNKIECDDGICYGDFTNFEDASIDGFISCHRYLSQEDPKVKLESCFFTFSPQFEWDLEKISPFSTDDNPDMLTIKVKEISK